MASNCYRKSTLTALNTTPQTFVTAGTILSPGGQLEKTYGQPCLPQCHAPCVSCVEGFGGLFRAPALLFLVLSID